MQPHGPMVVRDGLGHQLSRQGPDAKYSAALQPNAPVLWADGRGRENPGSRGGGGMVCWPILTVAILALGIAICLAAALRLHRPSLARWGFPHGPSQPSDWIADSVRRLGKENARVQSKDGGTLPETAKRVFAGTHIAGRPAGKAHGMDWLALHHYDEEDGPGHFGQVELSENAQRLRAALRDQGFHTQTMYHGTKNEFVPSILSGGFRFAGVAWFGQGIYVCSTFQHAQCYASGEGGSVLQLEVYYRTDNRTKYFMHVHHDSTADDVYVVFDPLLIIPISVQRCCPFEQTCI